MPDTRLCEMESEPIVVRCFGCRNRFGLAALIVLECGVVCCWACAGRRQIVRASGLETSIEIIG
jgi:hypothetical protein